MSVYPASVTPFAADGSVDSVAIVKLVAHFRAAGCAGIVLAGTNGEGPSLSAVEKRDMVRTVAKLYDDFEVILGIATPSLEEAKWLAKQAQKDGAKGLLVMPPAYFREASEEGLFRWFEALASASDVPIFVYNFPQRTGIKLSAELVARLANLETVAGLKDSSGDPSNLRPYRQAMPDGRLYVGDETLLLQAVAAGWTGTISGAANVLGMWLVEILKDAVEESRQTKFQFLLPAIQSLRDGGQPALNKALLAAAGILPNSSMRLPLLDVDQERVETVKGQLRNFVKFP